MLRWRFEPDPFVQLAMGSLSAANGWIQQLRATAALCSFDAQAVILQLTDGQVAREVTAGTE